MEKVLQKIKEVRKKVGLSHENMAFELGISQGAYTNIENNESKLTVERLIKISEILEKPIYYFFDISPNNIYNQQNSDNANGYIVENLYQQNKDIMSQLTTSYEMNIKNLKEEVEFLKKLVVK